MAGIHLFSFSVVVFSVVVFSVVVLPTVRLAAEGFTGGAGRSNGPFEINRC
jgi:hypothetical protein